MTIRILEQCPTTIILIIYGRTVLSEHVDDVYLVVHHLL